MNAGQFVSSEGQAMPKPTDFLKVALGINQPDLAQTIWALPCATHHGNWFALVDGVKERMIRDDPFDELGGLAPITAEARHLFMFGLLAFHGADAVVKARTELMGWPVSPALASARASLSELARAVAQHLSEAT